MKYDYHNAVEGRELFCLAQDEDEAEKIAAAYSIELVGFSDGVAVFHCSGSLKEKIDFGKKNGLPELSINHTGNLY